MVNVVVERGNGGWLGKILNGLVREFPLFRSVPVPFDQV